MTGAKENGVEVRQGLNLPEPVQIPSDDFQMHLKAIKAALEKKYTANNLLRGCYKAAKKLHPKLPDALRKAIAIERANDPNDLRAELEVLGIALRETNCPIQLTVFDTILGDVEDQAYAKGLRDAHDNKMADNRYPVGSDLHALYAKGFRHGTADNMGITHAASDAAIEDDAGAPASPAGEEARQLAH